MEGGVLHHPPTQYARGSFAHHPRQSSIYSAFRPPRDFSLSNWLEAKLNKMRRKGRSWENAYYMRGKKRVKKIVESL